MKIFSVKTLCTTLWILAYAETLTGQITVPRNGLDSLLVQAETHVVNHRYTRALESYKHILSKNEVIPGRACYFMSVSLYHTQRLPEAQRFVMLYLKEVHAKEQYYKKAQTLKERITVELQKIQDCNLCNDKGQRKVQHHICQGTGLIQKTCPNCTGNQEVICPLCYGQGLLIQKDVFDKRLYLDCPRCKGKGRVACEVCQGIGLLHEPCNSCKGQGTIHSTQSCTHILD